MHQTANIDSIKVFLTDIYECALRPVLPKYAMVDLEIPDITGKIFLLSVGKAAAQMASAIYNRLPKGTNGMVVTRTGYAPPGLVPENFSFFEASHPVPDAVGAQAAQMALAAADDLGKDDMLLLLMSGGASSLLPAPAPGINLAEKQAITRALLHSGAPIDQMNIMRKHLSAIKGGKLAARAFPAATHMIAISDIPGDDMAMIGSGPSLPDNSTCADAISIAQQYEIALPDHVKTMLENGMLETPKSVDAEMQNIKAALCARPANMCAAAKKAVEAQGYEAIMLGDDLEGDALALGREHAKLALKYRDEGRKLALISGGEATVKVRNKNGRGGRCTAYLLALAIALNGATDIIGFAADSDGIDGSEDNAGAFFWPGILDEMGGIAAAQKWCDSDNSYLAFAASNALLVTGPSGTNVNDLRMLLIH